MKGRILNDSNTTHYEIILLDPILTNTDKIININKRSDNICLDYVPKASMVSVGSKVLIQHDTKLDFRLGDVPTTANTRKLSADNIKFMGVVIKKISSTRFKVMMSINSYESDSNKDSRLYDSNTPLTFQKNPIIKVSLNEITLYKKANLCIDN